MRLYLHIGYPQTGTTALQSFFCQNAARLAAARLLYPQTGQLNTAHYLFNFALGLGRWAEGEVEAPAVLAEKLRQEVAASSCDRALLSSEYFAFATRDDIVRVRNLFADFDMRIVVYLRRHDHALEAAYAQSVKTTMAPPWQPNIESFILYQLTTKQQYDYLAALRQWASVFGREALIVRPYERGQNTPDLFADFLNAIDVADSASFARPGTLNRSLNPEFVAAIDAVNRASIPIAARNRLVGALIHRGSQDATRKPHLTVSMRRALVGRFRASYRTIAEEFTDHPQRALFREAVPEPVAQGETIPAISSETILALILEAAAVYLR